MRVLIINGSRNPSFTAALAQAMGVALDAFGVEVRLAGLAAPPGADDTCGWLRQAVAESEAVVLTSPVHHCGYSGLLKAALDTLPGGAFADRAVGLLAQGSSPHTGRVVCEQLRTVATSLGGWVVPTHIAASRLDFTLPPGGRPTPSPQLLRHCRVLAGELHRCVSALAVRPGRPGRNQPEERWRVPIVSH
ncbi:NADPH-dependent FMN reductase [Streptomyces sp. NPDC005728]|uniref:NADPH-dependent FMN reductase n=1 Tax=Streptomyces sp. NPDC005728 TaxID=3157054 RepID=UPI0033EE8A85